uniref:Tectonin beta-propeller repeat-containing protein 1 n=1 Tax=Oncorhynchus tshawytscha TaxID=74940 RepID=A0A8C8EII6_ONCTS
MSVSLLWAVDVYGRVYSLSTGGQQWEQCQDAVLEFKRVTAVQQCCWGIACDHHIYLNVHSSDVPIRYQEETYENQRWNPKDNFSDHLLPSDRWHWSDITGLEHQPLDSFLLPSTNWEWEGDWYIDENFGGEPTEKGGWTYALDFPATYIKDKKWNSCVRRRRWIRYRRYKATDTWAKIPSEGHSGPLPDPFNDISCGGWEISEEPRGRLSLWAVSLQGKVLHTHTHTNTLIHVWFREGIHHHSPEGEGWEEVSLPGEVVQISCGPGDLVWAVCVDRAVYFRQGVTSSELSGKAWKAVNVPRDGDIRSHSSASISSLHRWTWTRNTVTHFQCLGNLISIKQLAKQSASWVLCVILISLSLSPSHSAGCFFSGEVQAQSVMSEDLDTEGGPQRAVLEVGTCPSSPPPDDSFISEMLSDRQVKQEAATTASPSIPEEEVALGEPEAKCPPPALVLSPSLSGGLGDPQWSNVDLEETQTHLAVGPAVVRGDSADTCSLSSVATYTLCQGEPYGADEHPLWAWVSGGGCGVNCHSQLNWFNSATALASSVQSMSLSISPAQTAAWRKQIFEQLSERSKREMDHFKHYEQAVEQSVWVKKGAMQWWRDWKPHKWVDVRFALEQFSGPEGNQDGILFLYYNFNEEKKYLHAFINEVTILVPVLNDSKHTFAIYTAERTKQRWPIRLAAATEVEMHDWLALLSVSCCDSRGIQGPPSKQAIWSVTCKGDIFVCEPSPSLEACPYPTPCDQMFWRQVGGHLRLVECNSLGVVWGVGYDHTAWVYTGYGGGFFQGLASSTDNIFTQTDVKCVYIYENQRWNPVTGYTNRGLPTDRYMWSDATGLQECTKANAKPPSPHWTWVADWTIDYGISGGTDREGWQYAADFPRSYHGHKTLKDFVRRRRWARKCKLTTTGPWQEVPPIPLSDVTIVLCGAQSSVEPIPLWAISNKGDVLCRLGVTLLTPAGTSWLHVGTDQPFKSISIGGANQVWAIARDGSAFYRGSVSSESPAGDCWYHIPCPERQKLQQVSVGRTSVYTVDQNGNLWFRQGLTPSYPQGSSWEHICNNVRKVSVGPLDQVWIIADKVQGSHSLSCGTVCHRLGVQPMEPKGQSWDYGIGGGWDHITVRGNSIEAPRVRMPSLTPSLTSSLTDPLRPPPPRSLLPVMITEMENGNAVRC